MARPTSNPDPAAAGSDEHHKLTRTAVLALHNALAASGQHPDSPEVWRPARRRAIELLRTATQRGDVHLGLRAGSVYVDHEAVVAFHPDEPPFGLLRRAGIGELVLQHELGTDELEQLVCQLSAMRCTGDGGDELTALIDAAQIPGVQLNAAIDLETTERERCHDWNALPAPQPSTAAVRAMIERDCNSNLPALAARQLFDDLEADVADAEKCSTGEVVQPATQPTAIIARLMRRVLDADDIGTTTWLLTELEHRPQFDAAVREQMLRMAREHCTVAWLQARLDRGTTEDLLQISALAMQLGDEVAELFANAAAAVSHPMSQWLGDLLGHPGVDAPPQSNN